MLNDAMKGLQSGKNCHSSLFAEQVQALLHRLVMLRECKISSKCYDGEIEVAGQPAAHAKIKPERDMWSLFSFLITKHV